MILNYINFKSNLILEGIINESFLYFSPPARKILKKSGEIGRNLLSVEYTDVKPDITFIDLDKEKDGYFSFITMKNAEKYIKNKYPTWEVGNTVMEPDDLQELWDDHITGGNSDTEIWKKSRNSVKIGKLVGKIFPNKYSAKEIEEFTNSFKSVLEKSAEKFELVEGNDIDYWYYYENYAEMEGTLGNSCMSQKRNIFELYVENPQVCRLLILKENDKLLGRAIVWKLQSIQSNSNHQNYIDEVTYFMDRQYTIKDSDVQKFRNYAKEQGWAYKTHNNHHSFPNVTINDVSKQVDMTVKLKCKSYNKYPYMDTFRVYDPHTGILYNNDDENENRGRYILDDTCGGYTEIEEGVWSEWHGRMIPEDQAVWSDPIGDYILKDRSVHVGRGSRRRQGWYPEDYDDIAYDSFLDEFIHTSDAIWSDIYNSWIFEVNAVEIITDLDDTGDIESEYEASYKSTEDSSCIEIPTDSTWYKKISINFPEWINYDYIDRNLVTKVNNIWIPKIFIIPIYKISEPQDNAVDITGVEYLYFADALALGYDLNEKEEKDTDWFTYTDDMINFLEITKERLTTLIPEYESILANLDPKIPENKKDIETYRFYIHICENRLDDLEKGTWD